MRICKKGPRIGDLRNAWPAIPAVGTTTGQSDPCMELGGLSRAGCALGLSGNCAFENLGPRIGDIHTRGLRGTYDGYVRRNRIRPLRARRHEQRRMRPRNASYCGFAKMGSQIGDLRAIIEDARSSGGVAVQCDVCFVRRPSKKIFFFDARPTHISGGR